MSTRSFIGLSEENGYVCYIYCHFDGYLEGVGKTLLENYKDEDSVAALIKLGDISCLGENLESTVAYHRDRKEPYDRVQPARDLEARFNKDGGIDYFYLFKNGEWYVSWDQKPFEKLSTFFEKDIDNS